MDKVTVKVMSHSCKMADITDQGVSCKHQNIFFFVNFCFCICGLIFFFFFYTFLVAFDIG